MGYVTVNKTFYQDYLCNLLDKHEME